MSRQHQDIPADLDKVLLSHLLATIENLEAGENGLVRFARI
jgi:hypothetical protein